MSKQGIKFVFFRAASFCYKFAWNPPDYFPPIAPGTLSNPEELNSDVYATDPSQDIAKYRIKELKTLYSDASGDRRRRNVAYTLGPSAIESTGPYQFTQNWTIYSPAQADSCVYLTVDPYSAATKYCDKYPQYEPVVNGYKAILTGCFDLSAQPVLAWESAVDTISILRVTEGLQTIQGFSPILFSNSAYVGDPANQTDAVLFYLKDIYGYVSPWNYNTLYSPQSQLTDTRRGVAIYYRVQRDNFATEYRMCDIPFEVQYLDNVFFDGIPAYPDNFSTYKQYLSLVDGNCNRYTAVSAAYFVPPIIIHPVYASTSESKTVSIALTGSISNQTVATFVQTDVAPTVTPTVTGFVEDAVNYNSATEAAHTISLGLTGAVDEVVVSTSASDANAVVIALSGSCVDSVIGYTLPGEAVSIDVTALGALETV